MLVAPLVQLMSLLRTLYINVLPRFTFVAFDVSLSAAIPAQKLVGYFHGSGAAAPASRFIKTNSL